MILSPALLLGLLGLLVEPVRLGESAVSEEQGTRSVRHEGLHRLVDRPAIKYLLYLEGLS